jgi:hypothetical protein
VKILKYNICTIVDGEEILSPVTMGWNEANEETAKREAYNGEYTIEDDGQVEQKAQPTESERITELEEALELLLSGVTE